MVISFLSQSRAACHTLMQNLLDILAHACRIISDAVRQRGQAAKVLGV